MPTRVNIQPNQSEEDSMRRNAALERSEYSAIASKSDHKVREVSERELSKSEQKT